MKTILCLTDFTSTSNHAVRYGYDIAKCMEAEIILSNVTNVPAEIPQYETVLLPLENYRKAEAESMKALKTLQKKFELNDQKPGFHPPIICLHQTGIVTDVVNCIVDNKNVDLIVVGTHASRGLKQLLLGNHVRYMIDSATVPLLLVPPDTRVSRIHWIALATSFSPDNLVAAGKLIAIAEKQQLEFILMHIIKPKDSQSPAIKQQQFLTQLYKNTGYQKISCQSTTDHSVGDGLRKLCSKNENNGLLAIVHRNRNFIAEILKGSITQKISKKINFPLLVIQLPNI